jgi:hypothetical protein
MSGEHGNKEHIRRELTIEQAKRLSGRFCVLQVHVCFYIASRINQELLLCQLRIRILIESARDQYSPSWFDDHFCLNTLPPFLNRLELERRRRQLDPSVSVFRPYHTGVFHI